MQSPISNNQVINNNDLLSQTGDNPLFLNNAAQFAATPSQTLNPLDALKLRFTKTAITSEIPADHPEDTDPRDYQDGSIAETTSKYEDESPFDRENVDVVERDVAELTPVSAVLTPDAIATNVSLIQPETLNAIEVTPQPQTENLNTATAEVQTKSPAGNIWGKATNAILTFNGKGGIFNRAGKIRKTDAPTLKDREQLLSSLRK